MTTPRERERVLEDWLKQSGGARSAPTPECLDAETAAAWADDRLRGPALAEVQLHVADCSRCQALMAALLKTTPAQVAAALERSPRRWLSWAMPIAAAATIVIAGVLWVNTPPPATEPVDVGPMPPAVDRQATGGDTRRQSSPARAGRARVPRDAERTDERERSNVQEKLAASGEPEIARRPAPQAGEPPPVNAGPSAPPATAPRPATPVTATPPVRPQTSADSAATAAAATPSEPTTNRAEELRDGGSAIDRLLARPVPQPGAPVQVRSPNAAVQWRVNDALIERTTDGGSTWAAVASVAAGSIAAGSAPSATVCWLAGRGGTVLRTTDGVTWSRLAFPETVDLVAVGAVNAQTATVTAADGRVFATANGGQYWIVPK